MTQGNRFIWCSVVAFGLMLMGCSGNQSSQSRTDRAMSLINRHDYFAAARILEGEHFKRPQDRDVSLLLAQAELGQAHFEMFSFINGIIGEQDPSQYISLTATPKCDNGAITKIQGYDIRCLLYRLFEHLPDTEGPHFLRARSLLDQAFPDAAATPADVNFQIAFVDASSALEHLRALLLESNQKYLEDVGRNGQVSEDQFKLIVHHLKRFLADGKSCLNRIKYSYGKLRKVVFDTEGKPIVKVGDRALVLDNALDGPEILRFLADLVHDHMVSIDQQFDYGAGRALESLNYYLGDIISRLSWMFLPPDQQVPALEIAWRFDHAISLLLNGAADALDHPQGTTPVDVIWRHPPKIFADLNGAILAAWDQETRKPLLDYFASTRSEWSNLDRLMNEWDGWLEDSLSFEQREALLQHLRTLPRRDQRFSLPPDQLTSENLLSWERGVTNALQEDLREALAGKFTDLPGFTREQSESGQILLIKTAVWVDRNLWN